MSIESKRKDHVAKAGAMLGAVSQLDDRQAVDLLVATGCRSGLASPVAMSRARGGPSDVFDGDNLVEKEHIFPVDE